MTTLAGALTLAPPWAAFLVAAVVVLLVGRRVGQAVAAVLTALTVPWILLAAPGEYLVVAPLGFEQTLYRVDGFTRFVTAVFGFVASVAMVYGAATGLDRRATAYALTYAGASVAAVLAGDWLTLLMAWELMAVTATVLVWHHGGDAVRPAFRYAVYHLVSGVFLSAAVALQYAALGTFDYDAGLLTGPPLVLAVAGVGVNLGFVGLHFWIPDTYPRPHVASSVVLAAFTTKVAVYVLARVAPEGSLVVAWLGGAMVLYGVTQAVLQTEMRRLLSYHIVSQVGYMVVALGVASAAGVAGAFAHLGAHVLYKGLLFVVAGVVVYRTGEESLKRLGGLGRRMPLTFGAFLVAALAITGVPGFSGFVSKGLVTKAVESGAPDLLWWALVAGSVGTALSFAKFGYYAFVRAAPDEVPLRPGTPTMALAMLALAGPSVLFGLSPGLLLGAVPGDPGSFEPYATSELLKAAATTLAGVLAFVALRGALATVPPVDVDRVLHPAAKGLAQSASKAAIAVGETGERGVDRSLVALAPLLGPRDVSTVSTVGTTLLVLAGGLGLALLLAVLA
jgi:multicomponent Na+:H+ antiporter subunit D